MKSFAQKGTVHLEDMPGMMVELLEQIKVLGDKIDSMQNANTYIQSQKTERELLTTLEVAKMLKVARITIYRMASRGDIPCYRNGKNLMFYREEILRWVDSTKTNRHLR
jgi:excisionase family DNA binding protein